MIYQIIDQFGFWLWSTNHIFFIKASCIQLRTLDWYGLLLELYTELLVLKCIWISLKFIAQFVYMSPNLLPTYSFIVHLLQEFGHASPFGFYKRQGRSQFEEERDIFGQLSDDKIINLIIMLVKKCISSFSRKELNCFYWYCDLHVFTNILLIWKKYVWYWCIFEMVVRLGTSFWMLTLHVTQRRVVYIINLFYSPVCVNVCVLMLCLLSFYVVYVTKPI